MPGELNLVSCAVFGNRPERDAKGYYKLLLNDLAERTDLPIRIFTNDSTQFHPRIESFEVGSPELWAKRIWDDPDWIQVVSKNLSWHPRNKGLAQSTRPELVGVYLAKLAMALEMSRRYGNVLWLDAGFLFSVVYGHDVPTNWRGYNAETITERLVPTLQNRSKPLGTHIIKKARFWKLNRPHFHGMSPNDIKRLAQKAGTRYDANYVTGAMLYLPAGSADQIEQEAKQDWQTLLDMQRMGTEETLLSLQRWRHGWETLDYEGWITLMREDANP